MAKKTVIIFTILLCCLSVSYGQIYKFSYKLKIDSLPSVQSWNNFTDYNETGTLTHSFGSEPSFSFLDQSENYDDKATTISFRTFIFTSERYYTSDPRTRLTIIFDSIPRHILYFEYKINPGDNRDDIVAHLFRATNIDVQETPSSFEWSLSGNECLNHNIFDSSYKYQFIQSGSQSFETIYVSKEDTVVPGTMIHFAISKDHFIQSAVSSHISTDALILYPSIASSAITVQIPQSLASEDISIIDVLGRTALSFPQTVSEIYRQLDITSLGSGVYYLIIGNNSRQFIVRR